MSFNSYLLVMVYAEASSLLKVLFVSIVSLIDMAPLTWPDTQKSMTGLVALSLVRAWI